MLLIHVRTKFRTSQLTHPTERFELGRRLYFPSSTLLHIIIIIIIIIRSIRTIQSNYKEKERIECSVLEKVSMHQKSITKSKEINRLLIQIAEAKKT